jgi:Ca2+-binding RTX toxin-like protein
VLLGGDGDDLLVGGSGDDTIDGNRGTDTAQMGAGADRFVWDPGDGSDTVEGQGGKDVMDFNGSNIGEQFDVSADGPRVKVLRNVGAITMDINGVDGLVLRALGGADQVTLNDLSGTDLDTAAVDLSASTGAGDGEADTVIQNGTEKADHVRVSAEGQSVLVDGLHPQTTITGAEAAKDALKLNTLGGDDSVTVGAGVGDLLTPSVDLGAGQ